MPNASARPTWTGALGGLAVGAALGVLAAFLGEVRAPAPLLLALMLGGALLGAFAVTRRMLNVGAGVLAVLAALCLLTPLLRGPLQALVLSETPVRADAIVILGGGVQCGTRSLEETSAARLQRGLELWRAGYAPTVTVSQQSDVFSATCPKLSDIERTQVAALYPQGGPEVLTLRNVTTTRDEAARVREYARQRGWARVLLVTSPSHSRRAATLLRSYGLNVVSVPAPETGFDMTLPLPSDRLYALRALAYEGLSRVKAALGGTPER